MKRCGGFVTLGIALTFLVAQNEDKLLGALGFLMGCWPFMLLGGLILAASITNSRIGVDRQRGWGKTINSMNWQQPYLVQRPDNVRAVLGAV